jgi:hypothetical protein
LQTLFLTTNQNLNREWIRLRKAYGATGYEWTQIKRPGLGRFELLTDYWLTDY